MYMHVQAKWKSNKQNRICKKAYMYMHVYTDEREEKMNGRGELGRDVEIQAGLNVCMPCQHTLLQDE